MVNKKYVAVVVVLLFVVVGVGSGYFILTASKTPATTMSDEEHNITTNVNDGEGNSELQATVTIEDGTFNPSNLTVNPGTTVTWIVKDDSNTPYMVTGAGFMSPHLDNGQTFKYKFNEIGTYGYYDMDHMDDEKLKGTILVQ